MIKLHLCDEDLLYDIIYCIGSLSISECQVIIQDEVVMYDIILNPDKVFVVIYDNSLRVYRKNTCNMVTIERNRFQEVTIK